MTPSGPPASEKELEQCLTSLMVCFYLAAAFGIGLDCLGHLHLEVFLLA